MAQTVLFGGVVVEGGTKELVNILQLRSDFIDGYCKAKGWSDPLTIEQILEIREQDGWKTPKAEEPATQADRG